MFGIRYLKAAPTDYVIQFRNGVARREGAGLSFFYYAPASTIVSVPLASVDVPFAFKEVTADHQDVTIQGQLTYRVTDPRRLAAVLDYSISPDGTFRSEDPDRLPARLVRGAQVLTRAVTQRLRLREALGGSDAVTAEVRDGLAKIDLPVEILAFSIASIRPSPEMAKALEAEAREALQREADRAVYERRNAAVEQEQLIKESELNTELAVEVKQREIRETKMAGDIAVEEQRTALIDQRTANERKEADSRAYALESTLKPLRDMDWKTLMAVSAGGNDPRAMIALAFRELAGNAAKIGELNVTPDLLRSLIGGSDD